MTPISLTHRRGSLVMKDSLIATKLRLSNVQNDSPKPLKLLNFMMEIVL